MSSEKLDIYNVKQEVISGEYFSDAKERDNQRNTPNASPSPKRGNQSSSPRRCHGISPRSSTLMTTSPRRQKNGEDVNNKDDSDISIEKDKIVIKINLKNLNEKTSRKRKKKRKKYKKSSKDERVLKKRKVYNKVSLNIDNDMNYSMSSQRSEQGSSESVHSAESTDLFNEKITPSTNPYPICHPKKDGPIRINSGVIPNSSNKYSLRNNRPSPEDINSKLSQRILELTHETLHLNYSNSLMSNNNNFVRAKKSQQLSCTNTSQNINTHIKPVQNHMISEPQQVNTRIYNCKSIQEILQQSSMDYRQKTSSSLEYLDKFNNNFQVSCDMNDSGVCLDEFVDLAHADSVENIEDNEFIDIHDLQAFIPYEAYLQTVRNSESVSQSKAKISGVENSSNSKESLPTSTKPSTRTNLPNYIRIDKNFCEIREITSGNNEVTKDVLETFSTNSHAPVSDEKSTDFQKKETAPIEKTKKISNSPLLRSQIRQNCTSVDTSLKDPLSEVIFRSHQRSRDNIPEICTNSEILEPNTKDTSPQKMDESNMTTATSGSEVDNSNVTMPKKSDDNGEDDVTCPNENDSKGRKKQQEIEAKLTSIKSSIRSCLKDKDDISQINNSENDEGSKIDETSTLVHDPQEIDTDNIHKLAQTKENVDSNMHQKDHQSLDNSSLGNVSQSQELTCAEEDRISPIMLSKIMKNIQLQADLRNKELSSLKISEQNQNVISSNQNNSDQSKLELSSEVVTNDEAAEYPSRTSVKTLPSLANPAKSNSTEETTSANCSNTQDLIKKVENDRVVTLCFQNSVKESSCWETLEALDIVKGKDHLEHGEKRKHNELNNILLEVDDNDQVKKNVNLSSSQETLFGALNLFKNKNHINDCKIQKKKKEISDLLQELDEENKEQHDVNKSMSQKTILFESLHASKSSLNNANVCTSRETLFEALNISKDDHYQPNRRVRKTKEIGNLLREFDSLDDNEQEELKAKKQNDIEITVELNTLRSDESSNKSSNELNVLSVDCKKRALDEIISKLEEPFRMDTTDCTIEKRKSNRIQKLKDSEIKSNESNLKLLVETNKEPKILTNEEHLSEPNFSNNQKILELEVSTNEETKCFGDEDVESQEIDKVNTIEEASPDHPSQEIVSVQASHVDTLEQIINDEPSIQTNNVNRDQNEKDGDKMIVDMKILQLRKRDVQKSERNGNDLSKEVEANSQLDKIKNITEKPSNGKNVKRLKKKLKIKSSGDKRNKRIKENSNSDVIINSVQNNGPKKSPMKMMKSKKKKLQRTESQKCTKRTLTNQQNRKKDKNKLQRMQKIMRMKSKKRKKLQSIEKKNVHHNPVIERDYDRKQEDLKQIESTQGKIESVLEEDKDRENIKTGQDSITYELANNKEKQPDGETNIPEGVEVFDGETLKSVNKSGEHIIENEKSEETKVVGLPNEKPKKRSLRSFQIKPINSKRRKKVEKINDVDEDVLGSDSKKYKNKILKINHVDTDVFGSTTGGTENETNFDYLIKQNKSLKNDTKKLKPKIKHRNSEINDSLLGLRVNKRTKKDNLSEPEHVEAILKNLRRSPRGIFMNSDIKNVETTNLEVKLSEKKHETRKKISKKCQFQESPDENVAKIRENYINEAVMMSNMFTIVAPPLERRLSLRPRHYNLETKKIVSPSEGVKETTSRFDSPNVDSKSDTTSNSNTTDVEFIGICKDSLRKSVRQNVLSNIDDSRSTETSNTTVSPNKNSSGLKVPKAISPKERRRITIMRVISAMNEARLRKLERKKRKYKHNKDQKRGLNITEHNNNVILPVVDSTSEGHYSKDDITEEDSNKKKTNPQKIGKIKPKTKKCRFKNEILSKEKISEQKRKNFDLLKVPARKAKGKPVSTNISSKSSNSKRTLRNRLRRSMRLQGGSRSRQEIKNRHFPTVKKDKLMKNKDKSLKYESSNKKTIKTNSSLAPKKNKKTLKLAKNKIKDHPETESVCEILTPIANTKGMSEVKSVKQEPAIVEIQNTITKQILKKKRDRIKIQDHTKTSENKKKQERGKFKKVKKSNMDVYEFQDDLEPEGTSLKKECVENTEILFGQEIKANIKDDQKPITSIKKSVSRKMKIGRKPKVTEEMIHIKVEVVEATKSAQDTVTDIQDHGVITDFPVIEQTESRPPVIIKKETDLVSLENGAGRAGVDLLTHSGNPNELTMSLVGFRTSMPEKNPSHNTDVIEDKEMISTSEENFQKNQFHKGNLHKIIQNIKTEIKEKLIKNEAAKCFQNIEETRSPNVNNVIKEYEQMKVNKAEIPNLTQSSASPTCFSGKSYSEPSVDKFIPSGTEAEPLTTDTIIGEPQQFNAEILNSMKIKKEQLQYFASQTPPQADVKDKKIFIQKCVLCDKIYRSMFRLKQHMAKSHAGQLFECDCCTETFVDKLAYDEHMQSHDSGIDCTFCGGKFEKANIKEHLITHIQAEQRHRISDACFNKKQTKLLTHYLKKHEFKVQCHLCADLFCPRSNMLRHYLAKHSTDRVFYSCDRCNKQFSLLQNLKRHLAIHEGITYECTMCHRKYSRLSDYKMHMNIHNGLKYQCPICFKCTSRPSYLKKHMVMLHQSKDCDVPAMIRVSGTVGKQSNSGSIVKQDVNIMNQKNIDEEGVKPT